MHLTSCVSVVDNNMLLLQPELLTKQMHAAVYNHAQFVNRSALLRHYAIIIIVTILEHCMHCGFQTIVMSLCVFPRHPCLV